MHAATGKTTQSGQINSSRLFFSGNLKIWKHFGFITIGIESGGVEMGPNILLLKF